MKSFKIKPEFFTVLKNLNAAPFTVDDLTRAYLNLGHCEHSSKKAARQFVYRNMQRLMKQGDLVRLVIDQGWPQYKLTDQFLAKHCLPEEKPKETTERSASFNQDTTLNLRERLNRYKVEMLSSMGEVEEYDAICAEIPELKAGIQSRYNESRDRCSKLLGRVKALENLLSIEAR